MKHIDYPNITARKKKEPRLHKVDEAKLNLKWGITEDEFEK